MNEQLQDRRDFEDSLNDQAHAGFGLRATPKNWAAFNEGLTHTINANQQARQGTAPEGNPVLSQAIHGPGITDSSSEAELLNYQYQLSGLGGEYSLQPMSGGASKRVRLEMSLEDQLTAHKQRLQYLREIEAEQSSEWRDMNASEAARLAAKRPTPDATPEWIQEGQASSAGFYAGLKDRAVQNGGLSGFGLYYGAHIGGLLADTGYHLTRSGYGAYQLLTDSQARSDAWNNLSYALTHPGEVVSGLQQGLNSWLAKPFGQQADDLFQIGTTALAGSVGVVGRLKVPGGVTNGGNSEFMGARGVYSTREFDSALAGGPLRQLSADNIKFTDRGISVVEKHTARFGPDPANEYMIGRLKQISNGKIEATVVDRNFYSHELREYVRYRRLGWETGQPADLMQQRNLWNNTHTATLEEYRIPGPDTDPYLYHPNAIKLMGGF